MFYYSINQSISNKAGALFVIYLVTLLFMVSSNTYSQEWEWVKVADDGLPPHAQYAMAYDSIRERIVLFGGSNPEKNDTWEWDGRQWYEVVVRGSKPSSRRLHDMVFDEKLGKIVMFGGWLGDSLGIDGNDMWEFDGAQWNQTQKDNSNWPGARGIHNMVYIPNRGIILHGGTKDQQNTANFETWLYDENEWSNVTSSDQRALLRSGASTVFGMMAYDANRDRVVLFGGGSESHLNGGVKNNTLEWDSDNWEKMTPLVSPPPRADGGMVYHPIKKKVILFGGTLDFNSVLGDTWEWNGEEWNKIDIAGPEPRGGIRLVYDHARDQIVMAGGRNYGAGKDFNDTWVLQSIPSGIEEWQMH